MNVKKLQVLAQILRNGDAPGAKLTGISMTLNNKKFETLKKELIDKGALKPSNTSNPFIVDVYGAKFIIRGA